MSFFDPILTRRILGLSAGDDGHAHPDPYQPSRPCARRASATGRVDPGQTALQISVILLWAFGGMLAAISVGTQALTALPVASGPETSKALARYRPTAASCCRRVDHRDGVYVCDGAEAVPSDEQRSGGDCARCAVSALALLQITVDGLDREPQVVFDGLGKTRVHMGVAIVMNIANFLMCIAFIYGPDQPGIPVVDGIHLVLLSMFGDKLVHMGVPGAGLASMLSSYVGLFIMLGWSLRGEYRKFHIRRLTNASASTIWQIAKLSVPSGIATMFAMGGFGFVLYVVAARSHGGSRRRSHDLFDGDFQHHQRPPDRLHFVPGIRDGDGDTGQPEHGRKEYDLAERFAYQAARIGAVLFLVLGLILAAWAEPILHFWNPDPDVIAVGAPILRGARFLLSFD